MLQLIGSLLIVGGFGAVGVAASAELKRRVDTLSSMITALEVMASEISYKLSPLRELLTLLSREDGAVGRFFSALAADLEGEPESRFFDQWCKRLGLLPGLTEDDRQILKEAGRFLGAYETGEQVKALGYAARRLSQRLTGAEAERVQKGRLYRTMGAGLGLLAVLLIL